MRSTRGFHKMTPRATARNAASAGLRARGIHLRRSTIVFRIEPIAAPFVDVVANMEQAVRVRCPVADRARTGPRTLKVRQRRRRLISPGILRVVSSTPTRLLPLRFGGQPEGLSKFFGSPFAVGDGVEPAHAHRRLIRLRKFRAGPSFRLRMAASFEKCLVIAASDGRRPDAKRADEDAVTRTLPGIAPFGPHPEPARGYEDHNESWTSPN